MGLDVTGDLDGALEGFKVGTAVTGRREGALEIDGEEVTGLEVGWAGPEQPQPLADGVRPQLQQQYIPELGEHPGTKGCVGVLEAH